MDGCFIECLDRAARFGVWFAEEIESDLAVAEFAGEPGGVTDVIGGWFHVMVVGAGDGLVARLTERVSV